jgi:uncharacterized protein
MTAGCPLPAVARPYASPYVVGLGIGLVLLASFGIMGRGLGASGAYSSVVTAAVSAVAPARVAANPSFARYVSGDGSSPFGDWLVVELLGVTIGGFLSAALAGRLRRTIERGPRAGRGARLTAAVAGGATMGVGAKIAGGCTSGLALSGGSVLSVGAWLFIAAAFAAGFATAPFIRRLWT